MQVLSTGPGGGAEPPPRCSTGGVSGRWITDRKPAGSSSRAVGRDSPGVFDRSGQRRRLVGAKPEPLSIAEPEFDRVEAGHIPEWARGVKRIPQPYHQGLRTGVAASISSSGISFLGHPGPKLAWSVPSVTSMVRREARIPAPIRAPAARMALGVSPCLRTWSPRSPRPAPRARRVGQPVWV